MSADTPQIAKALSRREDRLGQRLQPQTWLDVYRHLTTKLSRSALLGGATGAIPEHNEEKGDTADEHTRHKEGEHQILYTA